MIEWLLAFSHLPLAQVARAEVYLSPEQAAYLMFPAIPLKRMERTFSADEIKQIEKKSGESVREKKMIYFSAPSGERVIVDQVLGKHEFITYAVGIDASGKIKQIEILEYKETYGHEIKRENWRKQFSGKDSSSKLKLNDDIQNVGGATLSCKHVTDGVRRVVQSYEFIRQS